jgi:hypothetical protein
MKEQLYTIPVNDAFAADCECPVCRMYHSLETESIEFTMGPSYMEDDVRMETNKTGFCDHHVKLLYKHQNRLGLALMLHTHMQQTNRDLKQLLATNTPAKKGLFSKKQPEASPVVSYIQTLNSSCYICDRIERVFARYLATIFHCYEHDGEFREKFAASKGFCTKHFGILYEQAPSCLSAKRLEDFITTLNRVYLTNMERVTDDLEWFTDKFDYRNEDKPWKNSKDALPRSMTKTNSILEDSL